MRPPSPIDDDDDSLSAAPGSMFSRSLGEHGLAIARSPPRAHRMLSFARSFIVALDRFDFADSGVYGVCRAAGCGKGVLGISSTAHRVAASSAPAPSRPPECPHFPASASVVCLCVSPRASLRCHAIV